MYQLGSCLLTIERENEDMNWKKRLNQAKNTEGFKSTETDVKSQING